MPRGNPALIALLGVVAVAGFQNRDKIGEMLDNARQAQGASAGPGPGGSVLGGTRPGGMGGGLLSELGGLFGAGRSGGTQSGGLSGGLGDLVSRFRAAGHGQAAESWVSNQPNQPVGSNDVEHVIGDDLLAELQEKTGLSRADLVERLATALPDTVHHLTPQGRLPTDQEAEALLTSSGEVILPEPRQTT